MVKIERHRITSRELTNSYNFFFFNESGFVYSKIAFYCPQIISYDSPRGGVNVVTEKGMITTSHLLIQEARVEDNGRYQCNPSNAQPKSINVHVLNGKQTFSKKKKTNRN